MISRAIESILAENLSNESNKFQVSIGITNNKVKSFFGFRKNGSTYQEISNENDIFGIGSITKVFTTSLLAILIDKGIVKLDDRLEDFLQLSNFSSDITLKELATHTSGLPRLPPNMIIDLIFSKKNPYKYFSEKRLLNFFSKYYEANRNKIFEYSNLGIGVLGFIMGQATGNSYSSLLNTYIIKPLNLHETTTILADLEEKKIVTCYNKNKISKPWDFNALVSAGGIYSTSENLVQFLEYQMSNSIFEILHKPHYIGKDATIGLGWHIKNQNGHEIHWHNGAASGYTSICLFNKSLNIGVSILSNFSLNSFTNQSSVDHIGLNLMDYFINKRKSN
jgi:CubicO group peptidase (beta-lactamase class C family)